MGKWFCQRQLHLPKLCEFLRSDALEVLLFCVVGPNRESVGLDAVLSGGRLESLRWGPEGLARGGFVIAALSQN